MNQRLLELIRSLKSDCIFYVCVSEDIFYLTGFSGSFARLLVTGGKNYFFTDRRYFGVPDKTEINNYCEIIISNDYKREVKKILKNYKKIFISLQTPLSEYLWLKDIGHKPVISSTISDLRMIKDKEEIELIKKSIDITEKGILYIFSILKNNITEKEVASEFEYFLRKIGADSASFSPIIAFGKNSSVPHYKTGVDKLKENTFILIDVGVRYNGYCSDLTRVIGYRIIKSQVKKYLIHYNIIKTAKNKSVFLYKNGNFAKKPDFFVKKYLKKYGVDCYFTHSLGHGIGIDIHERPYINKKSDLKFKTGMIVTCEPGIYFPNEYGIRIEDDYLVTEKEPVKLGKLNDEIIMKE